MQHREGTGGQGQLGLFEPRQAVSVDRLRTEEGDALAQPLAKGLFEFLCSAQEGDPYLLLYRVSLTAPPAVDADDLHDAAEGFAAEIASRCQLGGALLVEDAARRDDGMGNRHYYGAVVTADTRPMVRELWMEHAAGAAEAGQHIKDVDGSEVAWTRRNRLLRQSLGTIANYGLRAKTPLAHRHVVASGSMRRVWGQARNVNVTINIHVHPHGSVNKGVNGSVNGSVNSGRPEGPERVRRTMDRGERYCLRCGRPIPSWMKWGTMYESKSCKVLASRERKRMNGQGGAE